MDQGRDVLCWIRLFSDIVSRQLFALSLGLSGLFTAHCRITNTAPSGEALARINGAAASFGCLARSLGPLLSGKLLTMGIAVQHLEIPFWTLSGVALLGFLVTPLLTDHA